MSGVKNLQGQTDEVKGLVKANLNKALARDEQLSDIGDRAEQMEHTAGMFKKSAVQLKRKTCWDNYKLLCILIFIIVVIIAVVLVILALAIGIGVGVSM